MFKSFITTAALSSFVLIAASAFADSPAVPTNCADGMKMMSERFTSMPDGDKKTAGMKEMAMAQAAMDAKDEKACMVHIGNMDNVYNGK